MKGMNLLKKELTLSGWIGFTISFSFLQFYNLYFFHGHILHLFVFTLLLLFLMGLISRISSKLLKQKDKRISKINLIYSIIVVTIVIIGMDIAIILL
ncbi:hypothetical protein NC661_06610 [Aquibacillus koreensis]|uniref:Uncharacterized protein n=1 Tax=Aquibacillus koreensis TaxID=279446 RepID=A0A9X4AHE5_9BACI|nr:hypothetical protein [Aquibacillus koreensis]MCT2535678.1 hypothetical protein [Aquibacillus koreensis]MDC3420037.1 hypothetical protein [Aquibacillus koreensis]